MYTYTEPILDGSFYSLSRLSKRWTICPREIDRLASGKCYNIGLSSVTECTCIYTMYMYMYMCMYIVHVRTS